MGQSLSLQEVSQAAHINSSLSLVLFSRSVLLSALYITPICHPSWGWRRLIQDWEQEEVGVFSLVLCWDTICVSEV